MSEHTPGPWCWRKSGTGYDLTTERGGALVVLGVFFPDFDLPLLAGRLDSPARLVPLTPDHPDARLIAAAPELLLCCRQAVAAYAALDGLGATRHMPGFAGVVAELKAAIAKAEGGAA